MAFFKTVQAPFIISITLLPCLMSAFKTLKLKAIFPPVHKLLFQNEMLSFWKVLASFQKITCSSKLKVFFI